MGWLAQGHLAKEEGGGARAQRRGRGVRGRHLRMRTTGAGVAGCPGSPGRQRARPESAWLLQRSLWEASGVRVSLGPGPPSSQTLGLAAAPWVR